MPTIIGAESFHGPVRDGKGWFQLAMVVRHDLLPLNTLSLEAGSCATVLIDSILRDQFGSSKQEVFGLGSTRVDALGTICLFTHRRCDCGLDWLIDTRIADNSNL